MIHVARLVGAAGVIAVVSGCVSTRSFVDIASERDQLLALHASLAEEGKPVSRDVVDSSAVLITYRYTVGDSPKEFRDTLRGADAVAQWLAAWRARPEVGFALTPYDLVHCGTYAIQTGTYPIPGAKPEDAAVRQFYDAQWLPDSSGRLKLTRIWLTPDTWSRPVMWGAGCRSLSQLTAESRRLVVTVEGLLLRPRDIVETITAQLVSEAYHLTPMTDRGRRGIAGAVGAMYRITPRYGIKLLYEMVPANYAQGRAGYPINRHPELQVDDDALGILGVWKVGWLRLGAGPAVAPVRFEWHDLLRSQGALVSSSTQTVPGVMGEVALGIPGWCWFEPALAVRFTRLRDVETPEYANVPPFPIKLRRSVLALGMSARLWSR